MSDIDIILTTIEQTGENGVDPTAATYERFFAASPESADLMSHMDDLLRGKMLNAFIELVIMPDDETKKSALHFEIKTHADNGIKAVMYLHFFEAFYRTIEEALGAQWNDEYDGAWQREISKLMGQIEADSSE
ncbi:MAG: globin [Bermanella sp.]